MIRFLFLTILFVASSCQCQKLNADAVDLNRHAMQQSAAKPELNTNSLGSSASNKLLSKPAELSLRGADLSAVALAKVEGDVAIQNSVDCFISREFHNNETVKYEAHSMATTLGFDPIFNGRLTLDYGIKLNPYIKLFFPVTFEHTSLMIPMGGFIAGKSNDRIDSQWSLLGGAGVKIRISEWFSKSSIFTEFLVQAGVYGQKAKGFSDMRHAVRLRPSVYLGWERVFETGLVLGVKAGVEYNVNLASKDTLIYGADGFNLSPMINLGFAW